MQGMPQRDYVRQFLKRPEELSGLKKPYSLFVGQLRQWLPESFTPNLAEYFDKELSQRGLTVPDFLKVGAERVKFWCERIDWNMNFDRIWRAMSADERKALDEWEKANISGTVGTSDWPGWEGKMPPRPHPPLLPENYEIGAATGTAAMAAASGN
jgi:hypothetical protein